ncbi:MAG: hypothetical protein GF344_01500, partial [Chitinivibrionales bacterium]|nr:hypothetical protein [Chitinivibrionales bacterium]
MSQRSRRENAMRKFDDAFLLSSCTKLDFSRHGLVKAGSNGCFTLYTPPAKTVRFQNTTVFIAGYVIPRHSGFASYKNLGQHELVYRLFCSGLRTLQDSIKGSFVLIIFQNDTFYVLNDIHAMHKVFVCRAGHTTSVSNSMDVLAGCGEFAINSFYPAVQALFQHPVGGMTIYKEVEHTPPASFIVVKDNVKVSRYWQPESLLERKTSCRISEFTELFRDVINEYFVYLQPDNVSLTLTGGRDTRSVLAALMNLGVTPHTFTFGFPDGKDVVSSAEVAKRIGLPFSNHYIERLESDEYMRLVREIIACGDSLVHLHRAHRLDAIEKEAGCCNGIGMLFTGAMGGDYIKGIAFDDYITTEFLRRRLLGSEKTERLIPEILDRHFVRRTPGLMEAMQDLAAALPYLNQKSFKSAELLIAHSFVGSLHDTQDLRLYRNYADYVVSPFMDIDILEGLFQTPCSLLHNDRNARNPFQRLRGGELQAHLISILYPPLALIPMANQYKPKDLLGNRALYCLKRLYLQLVKVKDTPTFAYAEWFRNMLKGLVVGMRGDLYQYYDFERLLVNLDSAVHQTHEGYWHKFSNPAMIAL